MKQRDESGQTGGAAAPGDYGGQGGQGNQLNFTGSTYAGGQGSHVGRGNFNLGTEGTKGRAPKGYQRGDGLLTEEICDRLAHNPDVDVSEVTLLVEGGKVTLEGTVPERRMKHLIEDLVDQSTGVKDIDNRVRVDRLDSQS